MNNKIFLELEKAISNSRLTTYQNFLNTSSNEELIKTYILNAKLSENFYFLLQNLEVTLRNAIYDSYTNCSQFSKPFFYIREQNTTRPYNREFHSYACWKMIGTVKHNLQKNSVTVTDGKIISELNFGFWTTLLEENYYKTVIWRKIFKNVFPYYNHTIKIDDDVDQVSSVINRIRQFRNRIFHFEAVIHKNNLQQIHNDILDVISWINPTMYKFTKTFDEYDFLKEDKKLVDKLIYKMENHAKIPRKKIIKRRKKL